MVSDNIPQLSKGTLELKPNETYEKTPPFQAHLLMLFMVVWSALFRVLAPETTIYLNGQNSSTANEKLLV